MQCNREFMEVKVKASRHLIYHGTTSLCHYLRAAQEQEQHVLSRDLSQFYRQKEKHASSHIAVSYSLSLHSGICSVSL